MGKTRAQSPPLTDAEREQIRLLMAAGKNRNQIARELGRSGSTISKAAGELGLSFERGPQVVAATQAVRADNAARRAAIIARLYSRTENVLARLEAATYTASGTNTRGEVVQTTVGAIPATDEKHLAASIKDYIDQAAKLEAVDSDGGSADARSMLGSLAAGLKAAYEATDKV